MEVLVNTFFQNDLYFFLMPEEIVRASEVFLLAAEAFLQETEAFLLAEDAYRIEFSPEVAGFSRCGEHKVFGFWARRHFH